MPTFEYLLIYSIFFYTFSYIVITVSFLFSTSFYKTPFILITLDVILLFINFSITVLLFFFTRNFLFILIRLMVFFTEILFLC